MKKRKADVHFRSVGRERDQDWECLVSRDKVKKSSSKDCGLGRVLYSSSFMIFIPSNSKQTKHAIDCLTGTGLAVGTWHSDNCQSPCLATMQLDMLFGCRTHSNFQVGNKTTRAQIVVEPSLIQISREGRHCDSLFRRKW